MQTGACWQEERVNKIAVFSAVLYHSAAVGYTVSGAKSDVFPLHPLHFSASLRLIFLPQRRKVQFHAVYSITPSTSGFFELNNVALLIPLHLGRKMPDEKNPST